MFTWPTVTVPFYASEESCILMCYPPYMLQWKSFYHLKVNAKSIQTNMNLTLNNTVTNSTEFNRIVPYWTVTNGSFESFTGLNNFPWLIVTKKGFEKIKMLLLYQKVFRNCNQGSPNGTDRPVCQSELLLLKNLNLCGRFWMNLKYSVGSYRCLF